jgi:cardiolipin synthase
MIPLVSTCSVSEPDAWDTRDHVKYVGYPSEITAKVIVKGTLISIVRNPYTSTCKGVSMIKNRCGILADEWLRFLPSKPPPDFQGLSIEQALDTQNFPAPIPGQIDFLIDGRLFFDDLYKTVNEATQSIDTRLFSFDNDDVAASYARLLKKKSEKIPCRVMIDEFGSISSWWINPKTPINEQHKPPLSMVERIKSGKQIKLRLSLNPGMVTDHTKLFLIDHQTAYLGGMNMGREYRYEWHDMMAKIRGPLVLALQNEFDWAWRLQGGWGDWGLPFYKPLPYRTTPIRGEIGMRILKTCPGNETIKQALLTAIRMSRKKIYLHVSYITSDLLMRELLAACARGVDVRMIFPVKSDFKLLNQNNRSAAKQLLDAGARIYLYPTPSHTKAVVVDDWACIGSANLDALSLQINEELNISFSDPSTVKKLLRKLFEKDFKKSKLLKSAELKAWAGSPLEIIADQM